MKILIVEDSKPQFESIKNTLLTSYPELDIMYANNFDSAILNICHNQFQIFILDIDLGEGENKNGLALAKYIRTIPSYTVTPILFLTSIPTEVTSAINETHCYSYLVKPYSQESLLASLSSLMNSPLLPFEFLEIKGINGVYFRLKPEDIIYVEISKHTIAIHTELNTFETNAFTITQFCNKLSNYIVQIHKSYAVNPLYVFSTDTNFININYQDTTVRLPIGRKFRTEVIRRL